MEQVTRSAGLNVQDTDELQENMGQVLRRRGISRRTRLSSATAAAHKTQKVVTAMEKISLFDAAEELSALVQRISAGAESAQQAERFYDLLGTTMNLPVDQESAITGRAMHNLTSQGDGDSARWLAEELEMQAQLQYLPTASGHEKACLLFALPVVIPCGTSLQRSVFNTEQFEALHTILEEADVISPVAEFALLPRLLSYSEIFSLSYGQIRTLTMEFGGQVLSGVRTLEAPENFAVAPDLEGAGCSPYVDLYFVVGLVSTVPRELEDVFPALADAPETGARAKKNKDPSGFGESGAMANGSAWEKSFCPAFDAAFGALVGSLTVLPPDGITSDLRRGLELSREIGLMRMFELNVPDGVQPMARLSALMRVDNEWFVEVSCISARGGAELEMNLWSVLNHETEHEALDALVECLTGAGIEQEFPLADKNNPVGSLSLH